MTPRALLTAIGATATAFAFVISTFAGSAATSGSAALPAVAVSSIAFATEAIAGDGQAPLTATLAAAAWNEDCMIAF